MIDQKIAPFLMFEGRAEEAMNFYTSIFADSGIESVSRYGVDEEGPAGTVRHAVFRLQGQRFMCIDSFIKHGFTFTPSLSLHVTCDAEAEIDALYEALSAGGQVLMPLAQYPFSRKYCWVNDRYGVSWQLTLSPSN